jgi:phosphoglycolate phosphatase
MKSRSQDWPQAVVFDLDGTLIDSAPDIAYALNAATATRGLAPFALPEVKEMIGGGVPQLVERALVARGFPRSDLMPLVDDFLALYRRDLTTRTVVYDGARELLEQLHGEGRRLGVCTNKNHELTLAILDQLDLARYFGAVFGEREGYARKPDAAPLLETLAALGSTPAQALMVGDSEADVACARNANMPVIVVSFGYSKVAPEALGADVVIPALADLPRHFAAVNGSQPGL